MNQISLAEYRQQIEDAIQGGRYEEAVAHGRHILERYPECVGAYWLLGKAMLEAGQDEQATDMFQRVLSANPEHMLAWVGMSEIAKRRGELEEAVWYLQRAFELATDNEMVAQELRHLYGELEGSEPARLQLTESALAKLYLRGDLLTRAIAELRELIEEHPDRVDLRIALAEALWRDGQRLQASQICQEILDEQPYTLKANLLLGEIWSSSGRTEEAEPYLERAEALDPENEMARELFGSASPLPSEEPKIEPISYEAEGGEEPVAWLTEREKIASVDEEEAMEAEIEIPGWLQEFTGEPAAEIPKEPEEEEPFPEETVEGMPTAPEEEIVKETSEEVAAVEELAPEAMPDDDVLDWLAELEEDEIPTSPDEEVEAEEVPDWLAELERKPEEAGTELDVEAALEGPEPAEIPDWLQDLAPPAAEPPETAPLEDLEAIFEDQRVEEPSAEEAEPEQPEVEEIETEAPQPEALEQMAELPAWLESDELPSGDDALAWLAQLAEGKEEELLAQAEKEGEARLAEILGRPEVPAEEMPAAEEEPEVAEAGALEEEAFGWTAFEEEEEAVPEIAEAALIEEAEAPVLEEEEIPASEEAPPEAVAELDVPVVEEAAPEEPVPAEAAPEEAVPEEAVAEEEIPVPEEEEAIPTPEEAPPEAVAELEVPAIEEAAPEEPVPAEAAPEEIVPEEAVAEEIPVPEEEEEAIPTPEEAPPEAVAELEVPVVEEAAPEEEAREEAVAEPPTAEELGVPEGVPPAEAMEVAPEEDLETFIAAQQAYAEEHPDDHEARLELGRVLWQADKLRDAVEAYERLIDQRRLLDKVIADLEDYKAQWPDASLMQTLGDAYMRNGRLEDALDVYRQALASL